MRTLLAALTLAACACAPSTRADSEGAIPEYGYEVVNVYPHDRTAFTEGLFYEGGFLYEATGLEFGRSSARKVKLETGEVLQKYQLPDEYFGEGIIRWHDKMYQMTYTSQIGFIYNFNTLAREGEFKYQGQGWSFTTDGKVLYMDGCRDVHAEESDPEIRIWNPDTLQETGVIHVTADGVPVRNLNEMEWVKGEIYANIWQTKKIARIDPRTGHVVGWIDITGILSPADSAGADVANGIAYDARGDRLFVTGKLWPKLFEIRLVKKSAGN